MEIRMTLDGALEEVLVRYRTLIDDAVRTATEHTSIDEFVETIEAHVLALREQEPSFWELQVVDYIHSVVKGELKHSRNDEVDPVEGEHGVLRHIQQSIQQETERILSNIQSHGRDTNVTPRQHFMESYWATLTDKLGTTGDRKPSDVHGNVDDLPLEHLSYEALTFDEFNLEGNSVTSAPSLDEIPLLLAAFQHDDAAERHLALSRLLEIPTIELAHCPTHYVEIVTGLCHLMPDADVRIARDAIRLVYQIICQVEDASLFMDTYLILVDNVAASTSTGALLIASSQLSSLAMSDHGTRSADVCRLLLEFMNRLPHHLIHVTPEVLTRAICATLVFLLMDIGTLEKKVCRPLDIFALLDTNAKWFAKWMLKVPSRNQLVLSIEETGFVSDLMHCMARIRPFDSSMDFLERAKAINALSILSVVANTCGGRNMMFSWTKLPAHAQQQRRYAKWIGLDEQFQLEVKPTENDRLVHYRRCDREVSFDSSDLELEDVEPLGDRVIESIIMSAFVMHLMTTTDSCHEHELEVVLTTIGPALQCLTSHQTLVGELFKMLKQCTQFIVHATAGTLDTCESERIDGIDDQDPWFPFRRVTDPANISRFMFEHFQSVYKRNFRRESLKRRCAIFFDKLLAFTASFSALDVSTAVALLENIDCYRINGSQVSKEVFAQSSIPGSTLVSLYRVIKHAPYTMGSLILVHHQDFLLHVMHLLDSTDPTIPTETKDAAQQILLALADCSSATMAFQRLDLGRRLMNQVCRSSLRPETLRLLVFPDAADAFFANDLVLAAFTDLKTACLEHLDIAVSLNSIPAESNFRLRKLMRCLSLLRAALGTQFANQLLDNSSLYWCGELMRIIRSHEDDDCSATPQSEDICAIVFEMLSSMSGCIPSMVSLYDRLGHINAVRLLARDASQVAIEPVSACGYLASTLTSSLSHIGGRLTDWRRASHLCDFHPSRYRGQLSTTAEQIPYQVSSTVTTTMDLMRESIEHSRLHSVPLDMIMLSQVAWELIGDIEEATCDSKEANLVLTQIFGVLTFELIRSGRSKLSYLDGACERQYSLPLGTSVRDSHDYFPSDVQRKLMNQYYKDYAQRLGLRASPTVLHVMIKAFGKAAVDCFAITMLMILDQTQSEKDLLECLNYCLACPGIGFLWPGMGPSTNQSRLQALSTLAQAAEMILEVEHPKVFSTLRHCHCSVLTLALRWHGQCYWNFLPWNTIVLMIYLTALYGAEFQVYFFVAILRHMEPKLREIIARNADDSTRAYTEVLQSPITDFRFSPHRNMFLRLRSTYHDKIQDLIERTSPPPHTNVSLAV